MPTIDPSRKYGPLDMAILTPYVLQPLATIFFFFINIFGFLRNISRRNIQINILNIFHSNILHKIYGLVDFFTKVYDYFSDASSWWHVLQYGSLY